MKKRYENFIAPRERKSASYSYRSNHLQENKNALNLVENLIKSLPKSSQNEASLMIEHLKSHPEIISWNSKGEIIFKGDRIPDSNLTDLISSVTTNRKLDIPLIAKTVFIKGLSEANVPESWIKNKKSRNLMQSYKTVGGHETTSTPPKVKKVKWISST